MKQDVLRLNANFYPLNIGNWKKVFTDMVTGVAYPVDVYYDEQPDGSINLNKISTFNVIRSFDEWMDLPIRPYDEYVNTALKSYRIPPIVICANFDKIIHKRVMFPTKSNIWKRDNYTCQYTGKKLRKDELSVDHILPKSRGGENTWENLVTCDREINRQKDDRTPKEAGLSLLSHPIRPSNGMVFSFMRKEWEIFLDGGNFDYE